MPDMSSSAGQSSSGYDQSGSSQSSQQTQQTQSNQHGQQSQGTATPDACDVRHAGTPADGNTFLNGPPPGGGAGTAAAGATAAAGGSGEPRPLPAPAPTGTRTGARTRPAARRTRHPTAAWGVVRWPCG